MFTITHFALIFLKLFLKLFPLSYIGSNKKNDDMKLDTRKIRCDVRKREWDSIHLYAEICQQGFYKQQRFGAPYDPNLISQFQTVI
jgi:hypothetical protein